MVYDASKIVRPPQPFLDRGSRARTRREGEEQIDDKSLAELIRFFKLLDKWDKEGNNNAKVV